jgi:hypothetical protein
VIYSNPANAALVAFKIERATKTGDNTDKVQGIDVINAAWAKSPKSKVTAVPWVIYAITHICYCC